MSSFRAILSGVNVLAESDLLVTYGGPGLDDGRMEARQLAGAILALADLFQEAGELIEPNAPPISVEIQATDRGSFMIQMVLVQPDIVDAAVQLFNSEPATALLNLRTLIIGGGGTGLFGLLKWARGRRIARQEPASQPPTPGYVSLTMEDGDSAVFPAEVLTLYRSTTIRKKVEEVVAPLKASGVESMKFQASRTTEVTLELGSAEADHFAAREDEPEPIGGIQRMTRVASIASLAFSEGNKWRLHDGNSAFWVSIEDQDFLARVDAGELRFGKGDYLQCEIEVQQTRTADGKLNTENRVTRVLQHIPADRPEQLSVLDDSPDAT